MYRMSSHVIHLSLTTLLVSSVGSAIDPYLRLLSLDLVTFGQLAMFFAVISVISITQPVVLGIVADKVGNVKGILMACLIVATLFPTGLLWLVSKETVTADVHVEYSPASLLQLSWNVSNFQFSATDAIDLTRPNMSIWLHIDACHSPNATVECKERLAAVEDVLIGRQNPQQSTWNIPGETDLEDFASCSYFTCSASIVNATAKIATLKWRGTYQYLLAFLFIRILSWMGWNTAMSVLDFTAKRELSTDSNQLQILSAGGNLLVPLMCGIIIDYVERTRGNEGYFVAFVIGGLLAIISATLIVHLQLDSWRTSVGWKTTKMQCKFSIQLLLLVQLIGAVCWNFHWEFFVIYLRSEMQATKTQIGVAMCANGIGSMIILAIGSKIILRLGPIYVLVLGLLINSARFAATYFVQSVWIMFLLELFDGCARILPAMVGNHFRAAESPSWISNVENAATLVVGAGGILGASLGSFLISQFGIRMTYLIFASIAGIATIVFTFISISVGKCCPSKLELDESAIELVDVHQLTRSTSEIPSNDEQEACEDS